MKTVRIWFNHWFSTVYHIINLIREDSIFSLFRKMIPGTYSDLVLLAAIPMMIVLFLSYFMHTRLGLSIRATGDNPVMVRASSIDTSSMIRTGLMLSGIMTAVSGAAVGQFQKTTDINSGTGVVVIGLACLIMGETVLGRRSVRKGIAGALLGSSSPRRSWTWTRGLCGQACPW